MTEAQRAQFFEMRKCLDGLVRKIVDSPAEINLNMAGIRHWKEGAYTVGDVRMYDSDPYKCVQGHDSTGTPGWNPKDAPALWMQYHGTTKETARPFVHPTGAHDMYLKGEYAIFDGGAIKRANQDTSFGPDEYAQAWDDVE